MSRANVTSSEPPVRPACLRLLAPSRPSSLSAPVSTLPSVLPGAAVSPVGSGQQQLQPGDGVALGEHDGRVLDGHLSGARAGPLQTAAQQRLHHRPLRVIQLAQRRAQQLERVLHELTRLRLLLPDTRHKAGSDKLRGIAQLYME